MKIGKNKTNKKIEKKKSKNLFINNSYYLSYYQILNLVYF